MRWEGSVLRLRPSARAQGKPRTRRPSAVGQWLGDSCRAGIRHVLLKRDFPNLRQTRWGETQHNRNMAEPNIEELRLSDEEDDSLFASPSATAHAKQAVPSHSRSQSQTQQQPKPPPARTQSKQDLEDARNARLRAELAKIREVNDIIEGTTSSLRKAKENMGTVHTTVNNASTLLATWTRILSQTEHNQRLILNPSWQGASQDLEDLENADLRRQQEMERRAMEEQRKREEALRKAEDEERKKAAAAAPGRGGLGRRGSVRGAAASTKGYTGVGGQTGRGRGTVGTRGSIGRTSSTTRGRGRGLS